MSVYRQMRKRHRQEIKDLLASCSAMTIPQASAYLGIDEYDTGEIQELDVNGRLSVPEGRINPHLRCYKGLVTPDKIQRETSCPKNNAWRYYTKGISPAMALQAERHHTTIQVTIITALVIIFITVILGILNLIYN